MKFQDFFVPRWRHSNPDVRQKAVMRLSDPSLLHQIIDRDDDCLLYTSDAADERVRV